METQTLYYVQDLQSLEDHDASIFRWATGPCPEPDESYYITTQCHNSEDNLQLPLCVQFMCQVHIHSYSHDVVVLLMKYGELFICSGHYSGGLELLAVQYTVEMVVFMKLQ